MDMLNSQLIGSVIIDWDKIDPDSYLQDIPAISGVESIAFTHAVTFLVGENGSGKSTLLEAIAIAYGFNPEGGTRNYSFSTYDSHSELCNALRLSRGIRHADHGYFLRAESFYNVATKEEEYSRGPGGKPQHFHERSHGESFLALVQSSFRANGLYLLDEPEAALSPQRQLTLLLEIDRCAKEGSQFIIATHSPILLGLPGAEILSFDQGPVHPCTYEETDSYQVTSMFLSSREQLLRQLLDDAGTKEGLPEKSLPGKRDRIVLEPLDPRFSVCKVPDYAGIDLMQPFCFTGKTDEENSLVCPEEAVPEETTDRDDGWRGFRITGQLDFSLIGILAGISGILACNGIGIFAVSTFNTDYIFTKEENFDKALAVLKRAGYGVT
ncbi:MAG: AAA family ATPase [Lachnospiraceae bacterium]|nr:AAA family ATPase [Lachnospiraceae bacterium]